MFKTTRNCRRIHRGDAILLNGHWRGPWFFAHDILYRFWRSLFNNRFHCRLPSKPLKLARAGKLIFSPETSGERGRDSFWRRCCISEMCLQQCSYVFVKMMDEKKRTKKKGRKRKRRLYFRWGTMSNYIVVSSNKTRVKDEKRNIMKNYFHFLLHARSLMDSCLAFQQLIIIEDMLWSRYFISISSSMKRSRRYGWLIKLMEVSS